MMMLPKFLRTSLQNKMFISFIVILLLLSAVVTASFWIISRLGKASDNILKMNYNSIISSMQMMDDLETIQREFIEIRTYPIAKDTEQMIQAQKSFAQWLGRAQDNVTEVGETNILASIDSLYNAYLSTIQLSFSTREMNQGIEPKTESYRYKIRQNCLQLLEINQEAMILKSNTAQKIAQSGTYTLILLTALVFIAGIALSWGLSKRIVSPIVKLKEATQLLASGDYSVQLKRESEDELGILTAEFDEMAGKLREFNELNIRTIEAEQQKIGAILANIQDGIFFIGTDYNIRDVNKAALDAFKLLKNEVVGHHYLEIIKQDNLFVDLKNCIESQKPISYNKRDNILVLRKNDKQMFLEYFFSPVLSDTNELMGALFILHDITNLKELDRLKSEFVMIVSHELKTPLTSINMSIDLLRESLGNSLKDGDMELILIAKDEINRLRFLVNDLLDLSKIESGKIEMQFSSTAPASILDSVGQYFKNQLEEKNVQYEVSYPAQISNIWCDEEKLMLVFSNLVSNALKAIPDGGKIKISAEMSGEYILFCVQDNGLGIPLSYQNKIFDRFVQVEEQNAARGTGLGLTISREIVRAHGGSIWVESSPDNGAAFYFTIPIEPHPLDQILTR